MKQTSKTARCTAYCLLGLYITTIFGFVLMGVVHGLQHAIAESRLPHAEDPGSLELLQEAGCKPSADETSGTEAMCPGCSKQQKGSAVMAKYYRVFDFRGNLAVTIFRVEQSENLVLTDSDLYDQTSQKPPTPPPKHVS